MTLNFGSVYSIKIPFWGVRGWRSGYIINEANYDTRMMVVRCSFNQSFYCVVCCSTDPSVPPDSSVYNISTTRGTEVTVSLQGLTSGHMYYCKAAATNTNSNNCTGPVVGGALNFTFRLPHSDVTTPTVPGKRHTSLSISSF